MELANEQWNRIEPLIESTTPPKGPRGRKPREPREVGLFRKIAHEFAQDLYERGKIDIREAFIDRTFVSTKKWVLLSVRRSVAKAPRSWKSQNLLRIV